MERIAYYLAKAVYALLPRLVLTYVAMEVANSACTENNDIGALDGIIGYLETWA